MTENHKTLIRVSLSATFGLILGMYLVPTKIEIVEKIVERVVTVKEKDQDVRRTVTKVVTPDGTSTTRTDESITTNTRITKDDTKVMEKSYTKVQTGSKVSISLVAATNVKSPGLPDYGVSVIKPILGPFTIGVIGFKSGVLGASIGVQF